MFTWICPKCGKEVPPSYSECPNCAPVTKAQQPPVETVEQPPPPPEPPTPPPAAVQPPPAPKPVPRRTGNSVAVPYWLVVLLIAAGLGAIGFGLIAWQNGRHSAAQPASAATPALEDPAVAGAQANPLFRDVELTGLRLTEDEKQKAFVQFVVVNHSAADLGDFGAKVDLKAAAKAEQEPVGTFSFKTKLGPYEAKDMKVPLETKLRVYELPDWQFLRAHLSAK